MHPFAHFVARHSCGPQPDSVEPADPREEDRGGHTSWRHGFGGSPGVRRPLRFLAYKLELSEAQIAGLARILDELKVERAQAEVDERRSLIAIADVLTADAFDKAKAAAATEIRVQTAERLRSAVVKTLEQTFALLQAPQRERLAYLLRTGRITI